MGLDGGQGQVVAVVPVVPHEGGNGAFISEALLQGGCLRAIDARGDADTVRWIFMMTVLKGMGLRMLHQDGQYQHLVHN